MIIPADTAAITPQALNDLLASAQAGLPDVSSVRATALDGGYGYLSRTFRLSIEWDGTRDVDAPTTLIAKLPIQARLDDMTPDAVRMYRREVMFHRLVAPQVTLRTAKVWAAEFDDSLGAATLVYEDIGWMQSFEDDETVSVERIERALIELASIHASYWCSPELDDFDWLARPALTGVDQVPAVRFRVLWPRMVESGAYALSSTQLRWANCSATRWMPSTTRCMQAPNH